MHASYVYVCVYLFSSIIVIVFHILLSLILATALFRCCRCFFFFANLNRKRNNAVGHQQRRSWNAKMRSCSSSLPLPPHVGLTCFTFRCVVNGRCVFYSRSEYRLSSSLLTMLFLPFPTLIFLLSPPLLLSSFSFLCVCICVYFSFIVADFIHSILHFSSSIFFALARERDENERERREKKKALSLLFFCVCVVCFFFA